MGGSAATGGSPMGLPFGDIRGTPPVAQDSTRGHRLPVLGEDALWGCDFGMPQKGA